MSTYLYWIHYAEHTDPMSQGYIGVTVNPPKRLKTHSTGKNKRLAYGIANGATMTILSEYTVRDDALTEERRMRPEKTIGWNLVEGGGDPPKDAWNRGLKGRQRNHNTTGLEKGRGWNRGTKGVMKAWNKGVTGVVTHSEETKQKMSESHKGLVFTDEHRKNISEAAKNRPRVICEHCGADVQKPTYGRYHKNQKCLTN